MTWRRRLRRRLLWAGVLLGLVLLLVVVSALRVCVWGRDLLTTNASRLEPRALGRKGGTMTRTLILVVAIACAAVAIAPAALGEGRLAPLYPASQVTTYQDAGERPAARSGLLDLANAVGRLHVSAVRDALRSYGSGPHRGTNTTPPLAAKPTYTTVVAPRATSTRDIDWPQLGIGFALGIVLVIGLGLGVQAVRARPLAH